MPLSSQRPRLRSPSSEQFCHFFQLSDLVEVLLEFSLSLGNNRLGRVRHEIFVGEFCLRRLDEAGEFLKFSRDTLRLRRLVDQTFKTEIDRSESGHL